MVPFKSDEIEKLFRKLCRLVLKPEVVDQATTPYNLIKINVSDKNIQKEYMKTNIGTAATDDLRDNYIKYDIKKSFMKEYFNMVVDILIGLQERYPLKYSILRDASAISPVNMVSKKEECALNFKVLLMYCLGKRDWMQNRLIIANYRCTMNFLRMFNSNTKKISLSLIT